ncbi:MAG TPA: hypothetical protein ENK49_01635 [Gammaproteobacteria bacterium]|nr:hypothetical protein [Gammaproteobacteria bacterium]
MRITTRTGVVLDLHEDEQAGTITIHIPKQPYYVQQPPQRMLPAPYGGLDLRGLAMAAAVVLGMAVMVSLLI